MKQRTLSDETSIGLGLAALGRPEYINISDSERTDKSEMAFRQHAFGMLDFAYAKGIRYFDTAPSYGKGEQFLKDWNDLHRHPDVNLGTKWGYTYMADWKLGYEGRHEIKEHSINKLVEQWSYSKQMLPALDVYQVHSATFESGVLDNSEVLRKLVQIKKQTGIKIGITTSGENQKEIIQKALETKIDGHEVFDSFQVTYNILEQDTFHMLQRAKQQGKIIIIKEALANGRLFPNAEFPHYKSLYNTLQMLSKRYKVGVDALALRYCIERLRPNILLSGASNSGQLDQNLKALSFCLNAKDLTLLDKEKANPISYWQERSRLDWS